MTVMVMAMAVLPAVYLIFLGINEAAQAYDTVVQWFRAGRLHEMGWPSRNCRLSGGSAKISLVASFWRTADNLNRLVIEGGKVVSHFSCTRRRPRQKCLSVCD